MCDLNGINIAPINDSKLFETLCRDLWKNDEWYSLNNVNWTNIISWNSSQYNAFEQLVCMLFENEIKTEKDFFYKKFIYNIVRFFKIIKQKFESSVICFV